MDGNTAQENRQAQGELARWMRRASIMESALQDIFSAINEAQVRCGNHPQSCSTWHSFALGQVTVIASDGMKNGRVN